MKTIICRIAFCPICEKEHRPWKDNIFLNHSFIKGYFVQKAIQNGTAGFTPHLFILERVIGSDCVISAICSIYGCGVEYRTSNNGQKMVYGTTPEKWQKFYLPIKDWNALVSYKNDPQFAI